MEPKKEKKRSEKEKNVVEEANQKEKTLRFTKEKSLFKKRSFSRQYRIFRSSGLSVIDSFFNSFYIVLSEKSVEKEEKRLKEKGEENVSSRHFMDLHTLPLRFLSALFSKIGTLFSHFAGLFQKGDSSKIHHSRLVFLKEHIPHCIIIALSMLVALYIGLMLRHPVVLRAEINGNVVAVVENQNVVNSAINDLEDNVEMILGKSFRFPYQIQYTFRRQKVDTITPKNKITEELYTYILDSICSASGLYVDETLVAVCRDQASVEEGLADFIARNKEGDESGISNEIRIVNQAYPTDSIITSQQLSMLLDEMAKPLEDREKVTLPEQGVESVPVEEEIPAMVLVADNAVARVEKDTVRSNQPQPIHGIKLDFYTMKEMSYEASVPFKTLYEESSRHYTTMADTTVYGVNGISQITAKIYYVNGKEVKREVLSENVIKKPVDRVISIGTKVLPEDLGITSFEGQQGRFIMPRIGYISSPWGDRFDGLHQAWDIPGKIGDNIYAAASGTVITAIGPFGAVADRNLSYFETYGYCIMIQHENGYVTLYAHCNTINVSVGQKVKQGEKIGEVGETGRAFGSHVHFEVRKNDVRMNPERYMYTGTKTIHD